MKRVCCRQCGSPLAHVISLDGQRAVQLPGGTVITAGVLVCDWCGGRRVWREDGKATVAERCTLNLKSVT